MKIGPLESKPAATTVSERKSPPATAQAGTEPSAQVALSPAASALAGAGTDPAFDTAKVERVAQAIRDGKFTVNPEAIADKLILNAAELLGRRLS
ncbi:MAG: flagellar biosynthesis anti-sigma factor FlgM [Rubrivivax sp.]|jgi:negative regulator of flagellin synthesis FlgM|nr:flagellar biosynthesis anti-sigma factor FlgM [Betaproteobacteria bacterium]MBP9910359.1 flagellar biosynthesis anti-sigma factor FlgM [Rubrivivax sp.]MBK7275514.1 flagellar biosynthesis anti-sigma factor FlgM [Betaproteobacteria bacterium]MBK7458903.1 flagellar biosynthesis anti-sigma factor FlgM [Betaproteobacteria bacterium]MBK7514700.1 flagellar biosynthesis anti-sigma factor FlgM [Betaproteobacteria bacterium]